jgi:hypothetical protein
VAQCLQGVMSDATLKSYDFLNIMIYSTYSDSVSQMNDHAYKDILAHDTTDSHSLYMVIQSVY